MVNGASVIQYDVNTDLVYMPHWYFIKVVEYIMDTETNIDILKTLK